MSAVWLMSEADVARRLTKYGCEQVDPPEGAETCQGWKTKEGRYFTVPFDNPLGKIPDWVFHELCVEVFSLPAREEE